MHRTDVVNT